jgi:hypothetical protein
MEIGGNMLSKLLSGRFVLTIIVGLTFSWLAINKIITPDSSMSVILIIIYGYFTRERPPIGGSNGKV